MPWGEGEGESEQAAAATPGEPTDHVIVSDLPDDLTDQRLKDIFGAYGTVKWAKLSHGKGGKAGSSSAIIELDSVDEATYFVTALDENIPEGLTSAVRVRYKPPKNSSKGGGKGDGKGDGKGAGGFKGGFGKNFGGKAFGGKDMGSGKARPGPYAGGGKGKGGGGDFGGGGIQDLIKFLTQSNVIPGGKWQNDENTVFASGFPPDTTNNDLLRIFSPFGAIACGGCHCPLNPDGTAKGSGIINFLDSHGAQSSVATLNGVTLANGNNLRLRHFSTKPPGNASS